MSHNAWHPTDADLEVIAANNNTVAGRLLGRSKDTIRKVRLDRGIPNPVIELPATPPVVTTTPSTWTLPEDAAFTDDLWLTLETLQEQMKALDTEQGEVDVTIQSDRPALVVFTSDWHVGHTECDMSLLRRDFDTVRQTDGVYAILGGDLLDNVVTAVASRGMHHEQLTPKRIQKHLVDSAVEFMGAENVKAMLLGNHDEWSITQDDFDPIQYMAKKIGCAYLGAQGFINLTVGSETYRILAAHQFRMRSSFNLTHSAKRLEDFSGDADVVFLGHTHESAGESTQRRGQRRFYGQAGSYLQSSRYGKRLGFRGTNAEMPGAIFWPDKHKVLGVHDAFEDGVVMLRSFRG